MPNVRPAAEYTEREREEVANKLAWQSAPSTVQEAAESWGAKVLGPEA